MKRWKELEIAVQQYLEAKHIPYFRVSNYRCFKCGQIQNSQAKGFPDFMIFTDTGIVALECKTGKGKLTSEQKYYQNLFPEYIVIRDTIDALLERKPERRFP